MKTIPIGIAAEIRSELARQRLSMKELAAQSGISYDSIRRKVQGESRDLTVGELQRISEALNVPASTLLARMESAARSMKQFKGAAE